MSLTFTRIPDAEDVWGRHKTRAYDVTLDISYPATDGYVINAQDVGLKYLLGASVLGGNQAGGAVLPWIDTDGSAGDLQKHVVLRLFLPTGGGSAPATLTAPVAGSAGAITVTNGAITITNGAITITNGAITPGEFTVAAGGTPVTSTAANGTGIVSEATPTQATTTAAQATTTAAQATTTATQASGAGLVAGIGLEVGDTTDVSSLTYRLLFVGQ